MAINDKQHIQNFHQKVSKRQIKMPAVRGATGKIVLERGETLWVSSGSQDNIHGTRFQQQKRSESWCKEAIKNGPFTGKRRQRRNCPQGSPGETL